MTYEEAAREWNKYIRCQEKGESKECYLEYGFDCDKCGDEMEISIDLIRTSIEALEKQIPEKPEVGSEYVGVCKEAWYKDFRCPRCNRKVYEEDFEGYSMALYPACECGKLIDWSEVDE